MAYKMPLVCKEINLPCDEWGERITLEKYKELYGIDLIPFITLENNKIRVKFPKNTKINLVSLRGTGYLSAVGPINRVIFNDYDISSSDAETTLAYTDLDDNAGFGLHFIIERTEDFDMSNLRIMFYEL